MKKSVLCLIVSIFLTCMAGCSKNSSTEDKKPGYAVTEFLKAKTWEEKKSYIYDLEGLSEEKLAQYILNEQVTIQEVSHSAKIAEGIDVYKIKYSIPNSPRNFYQYYVVRNTGRKEKIDWKAMIGYNSIDFNNYLADPLPAPIKVRCYLEKSHLDQFGDYINMTTIENHDFPIKIVQKNNKEYQTLKELVDSGKKQVMVQISKWKCYPRLLGGLTVVEDCKVISPDWIER